MITILKGATSQSVYVEVLDSASTTGGRKTGIVFNSAGLTAYYARNQGSSVAITLVTLAAANSAYSSGGFVQVDATNMPGIYRLDVPDAAFATGVDSVVVTLKGATGMVQVSKEVQLIAANMQDAAALGLSRLDAAITSRMATFSLPTNFAAMLISAGGITQADVEQFAGVTFGARNIDRSTRGIVIGTVGAASTTTSIVTSSLDPAAAVTDQFKGRLVCFDRTTTTVNLRGQMSDIVSSTAGGVLTCTAFTDAAVSGDTFVIT